MNHRSWFLSIDLSHTDMSLCYAHYMFISPKVHEFNTFLIY